MRNPIDAANAATDAFRAMVAATTSACSPHPKRRAAPTTPPRSPSTASTPDPTTPEE